MYFFINSNKINDKIDDIEIDLKLFDIRDTPL